MQHVYVLHNVLTFTIYWSQNVDLIEGAFFQFRYLLEFFHLYYLDGNLLFSFNVDGFMYLGVYALPDHLLKGIVIDHFAHLLSVDNNMDSINIQKINKIWLLLVRNHPILFIYISLYFVMNGCFNALRKSILWFGSYLNNFLMKSIASSDNSTLVGNINYDNFGSCSCLAIFMISSWNGGFPVNNS